MENKDKVLEILGQNIVDSCVTFGSDFDCEDKISLTIEVYRAKDYTDKATGEKRIALFKNRDFDLVLNWLREIEVNDYAK